MKLFEILQNVPKLFDWYFKLPAIKRIQFNHILLLLAVVTAAYFNDKQHRDNRKSDIDRIDAVNDARAKEQAQYAKNLEYYVKEFNYISEVLLDEKSKKDVTE